MIVSDFTSSALLSFKAQLMIALVYYLEQHAEQLDVFTIREL